MNEPVSFGKPLTCGACDKKGQITITERSVPSSADVERNIAYLSPGFTGEADGDRLKVVCECGRRVL